MRPRLARRSASSEREGEGGEGKPCKGGEVWGVEKADMLLREEVAEAEEDEETEEKEAVAR